MNEFRDIAVDEDGRRWIRLQQAVTASDDHWFCPSRMRLEPGTVMYCDASGPDRNQNVFFTLPDSGKKVCVRGSAFVTRHATDLGLYDPEILQPL